MGGLIIEILSAHNKHTYEESAHPCKSRKAKYVPNQLHFGSRIFRKGPASFTLIYGVRSPDNGAISGLDTDAG